MRMTKVIFLYIWIHTCPAVLTSDFCCWGILFGMRSGQQPHMASLPHRKSFVQSCVASSSESAVTWANCPGSAYHIFMQLASGQPQGLATGEQTKEQLGLWDCPKGTPGSAEGPSLYQLWELTVQPVTDCQGIYVLEELKCTDAISTIQGKTQSHFCELLKASQGLISAVFDSTWLPSTGR